MTLNSRRRFFQKAGAGFATLTLGTFSIQKYTFRPASTPYFTNGFKIAEVGSGSVMIWTRLCGQADPNPVRHERVETVFRHPIDFDENMPVDQMDGSVKGSGGFVRATLKTSTKRSKTIWKSAWFPALKKNDFTVQIPFDKLSQETSYELTLEAKASERSEIVITKGTFRTAPAPQTVVPVQLTTSTCQYFWSFDDAQRGFRTYDSMGRLKPDFFIHTGDYIYYDKPGPLAKNAEKARHKWHAMNGWPALRDFFQKTPIYMLKDDHDLLSDDVNPDTPAYGELTVAEGLKIWRENVPLHDKPYRTLRWGKDLQIWLVEGREYRSANKKPDGNDKTIWGREQKQWFQRSVKDSDATFKLLLSPTPVVGPDRDKKTDNHANAAFATEGHWLRRFISQQKNMYTVNGDRHWQYVSVDPETGVTEFGSGPVSDYHAQGWPEDDLRPEHKFLRVKGGFLGIKVARPNGKPEITFTHYDVDGKPVHEEKRLALTT
jgi:alkaline phosphatase D